MPKRKKQLQKNVFHILNHECYFETVITFIHQVPLAKRERSDFSVFESSCHLPNCLPHTVEASHCAFLLLNVKQGSCDNQFL